MDVLATPVVAQRDEEISAMSGKTVVICHDVTVVDVLHVVEQGGLTSYLGDSHDVRCDENAKSTIPVQRARSLPARFWGSRIDLPSKRIA